MHGLPFYLKCLICRFVRSFSVRFRRRLGWVWPKTQKSKERSTRRMPVRGVRTLLFSVQSHPEPLCLLCHVALTSATEYQSYLFCRQSASFVSLSLSLSLAPPLLLSLLPVHVHALTMLCSHAYVFFFRRVPQLLAERTGAVLKFAQIREDMSLDLDHMKSLITEKTKLVAVVSTGRKILPSRGDGWWHFTLYGSLWPAGVGS